MHTNIPYPIETLVSATVHKIEDHSQNIKMCIDSALITYSLLNQSGDTFSVTNSLIELMSNDDPKVSALSILYLGMLKNDGKDATRAILPIRNIAGRANGPWLIASAAGIALILMGERDAVEQAIKLMKKQGVNNLEDFKMSGIRSIIEAIAHN